MRLLPLFAVLVIAVGCSGAQTGEAPALPAAVAVNSQTDSILSETLRPTSPSQRLVDAIDRVLIISIDGLRPDLLLRAYMPRVRGLCATGSYTFWAETTPEAYTLPCHVSMLTGASCEKHGVSWNDYIEQSYPNVPTLFEVAKQAGYSTAMATGKMKFIVLTRPGTMDHYYLPSDEPVSDTEVAGRAERLLREHRPQVMFVHLGGVDTAGHEFGWGTKEQIAAIEQADEAVGRLLNVLSELSLTDSTLIILTADHGGAGKDHTMNDPRSHFIPWIISGPGIRHDFDLTLLADRVIHIEDTFATACAFLGLDPGRDCQGKPVLEVVAAEQSESSNVSQP
jgi:predicted AlkP superfamily pyrophosphatase or phosphodiesterase